MEHSIDAQDLLARDVLLDRFQRALTGWKVRSVDKLATDVAQEVG